MTGRKEKRYIKIIGGGLVGIEVAYILARNNFSVHIFNCEQKSMCQIDSDIPLKQQMEKELSAWGSPTYLTCKRLGVSLERVDRDFVKVMAENLKKFPSVSFIDSAVDEVNASELTLVATGNNTRQSLIESLSNFVGKNKISYYHPAPMMLSYIDLKNLHHDRGDFYHVNLSRAEFENLCDNLIKFKSAYLSQLPPNEISLEKRASDNSLRTYLRPIFTEGERPYASIRMKKQAGVYTLIDFYSALSDEEQKSVIGEISAFHGANISSYSKIYKRTFLHASACLNNFFQVKNYPNIFVAGGFLGVGGNYENLMVANYIAYNLMREAEGRNLLTLPSNTCTALISQKILEKSVLNNMLLSLNYDIIKRDNCLKLDSSAIENFKENYYGKYFQRNNHLRR